MNILRITLVALTVLSSTLAFAQKGSVTKADSYRIKEDYANAVAEIEVAITIEKTAAKSRTWYIRGQIYEAIAKSTDEAIQGIEPNAVALAAESYGKVISMEKPSSSYYSLANLNTDALWGAMLNTGGEAYGEGNYELASDKFEKALLLKPGDSTTLLYAGAAAQQRDDQKAAIGYYNEMHENGIASEDVLSSLIYYLRKDEQNERALAVVAAAKEKYPKNKKFGAEELSLLMVMNRLDLAKKKLLAAIQEDPAVLNNHLNLALLYDSEGSKLNEEGKTDEANIKLDSAMASYAKAIEIDPENYVANYNSGAVVVNRAKVYLDEARDMDLQTYQKKGPALEEKAKSLLEGAVPYFEKVTEIKEDDLDAWTTLQSVYRNLKMYDKAEAAMTKVEELEAAQQAAE